MGLRDRHEDAHIRISAHFWFVLKINANSDLVEKLYLKHVLKTLKNVKT